MTGSESGRAGHVTALFRYPVKSMAAEPLEQIEVSWHGFVGDRRWAFVQESLVRSNFPWLTIRERSDMWHYRPVFAEPDRPDASRTIVHTPGGRELDVVDPALAEELGPGIRVIKQNRGVFDTMPLSLLTVQSIDALEGMVGRDLAVARFRPNLLVHGSDDAPFAEDSWVGSELRIGSLVMRVDQRDERCVMVNVDPVSIERDASVLRAIAQERDACFGVYGSVVTPGRVAVGDPVEVVRR
jgi:MOSC domain-containing protein